MYIVYLCMAVTVGAYDESFVYTDACVPYTYDKEKLRVGAFMLLFVQCTCTLYMNQIQTVFFKWSCSHMGSELTTNMYWNHWLVNVSLTVYYPGFSFILSNILACLSLLLCVSCTCLNLWLCTLYTGIMYRYMYMYVHAYTCTVTVAVISSFLSVAWNDKSTDMITKRKKE